MTKLCTDMYGKPMPTQSERLTFGKQPLFWEVLGRKNDGLGSWPADTPGELIGEKRLCSS